MKHKSDHPDLLFQIENILIFNPFKQCQVTLPFHSKGLILAKNIFFDIIYIGKDFK